MKKATVSFAALCSALCGCGAHASSDEVQEEIGTAQAPLAQSVATFEQILRNNQPADDVTNICEMTIPFVDPSAGPLSITVVEFMDGLASATPVTVVWSGSDFVDFSYAGSGDRLAVSGCSGGGACRLRIIFSTTGHTLGPFFGCQIDVTGSVAHSGVSKGNFVLANNVQGFDFLTAEGRQRMVLNAAGTRVGHQCQARVQNSAPEGLFAGLRFWINGVATSGGSSQTIFSAAPVPYPTLVNFTDYPGESRWGFDSVSTKVRHITPRNGTLVPGDFVWCETFINDSTAVEDMAILNYDTPPLGVDDGMSFM